jgi:A118 family predicted phage portal protein
MSLPLGGAWPPPPHEVALAQQAVWSAWLVGDPEGLSSVYGSSSSPVARDFFSREGGVLPAVARFFWGRPSATGNRKSRLHVPIAADIATVSADLLFSEPPQFVVEDANDATMKRVDLLNQGVFHAQLLEAAELTSALGGGWLRLVWDKERADSVIVDTVAADSGIGEWWMGRLQAVTFFTEFTDADKSTVLRHLERHEPGAIFHGLYRGTKDTLGTQLPLADHPSTEALAELVNEDGAIPTGVTTLTAAYVANMRPQRRWRKIEALAEMGRSDYDGAEQLMDALDECYTSWMRDLRLAKARLIVPEYMLTNLGKGQGMAWDEDREIFTQLNMAPATERFDQQITPQQFAIRVTEHQETASQLVGDILRAAGYSRGSLGDSSEAGAQMTATEVVARERESARTRDKKTRYWSQALDALLTTWLALDATIYSTGASGEVSTVWPDAAQPDAESLARTVELLSRATAVSTEVKVRMLHSDWDDAQIAAEVEAIKAEGGMSVPDLGPLP